MGRLDEDGRADVPSDDGTNAAPAGSSAIADIFGLSGSESAMVEDLCAEALAERGIDGRRFFSALRAGQGFQTALGLTPALVEAIYARAHRWFAIGYPDRAEPLFRALCIAVPSSADHWAGLGICLRIADQRSAAAMAFETAARLRADWEVPEFHLGELALLNDDLAAASRHLAAFDRLSGEDTPAQMKAEARRLEQAIALRRRG